MFTDDIKIHSVSIQKFINYIWIKNKLNTVKGFPFFFKTCISCKLFGDAAFWPQKHRVE